jgi:hypothetical protein
MAQCGAADPRGRGVLLLLAGVRRRLRPAPSQVHREGTLTADHHDRRGHAARSESSSVYRLSARRWASWTPPTSTGWATPLSSLARRYGDSRARCYLTGGPRPLPDGMATKPASPLRAKLVASAMTSPRRRWTNLSKGPMSNSAAEGARWRAALDGVVAETAAGRLLPGFSGACCGSRRPTGPRAGPRLPPRIATTAPAWTPRWPFGSPVSPR